MKIKSIITLILLTILFFSCENHSSKKLELIGWDENKVLQAYGTPDKTNTFLLSDGLYEYRYNLSNIFPSYKTSNIQIKELLWDKDKKNTAVWLVKRETDWVVIDNLIWTDDIKF